MEKLVCIRDFEGTKTYIYLKNFENVNFIIITVASGDEVMSVHYKDETVIEYDSSSTRTVKFHDGCYYIPLNWLDKFSKAKSSHDNLKRFYYKY